MGPIRILLADENELMRAGLRALLEKFSGFEVVGEARDGSEALRLIEEQRPNVVVMDFKPPEMNALEATIRAANRFPGSRVLMLSMNASQDFVLQSLQAGVAGYLLKNSAPAELEQAIRAVGDGETYLSPAIAKHVVEACLQKGGSGNSLAHLTPRQREVLQLIAEGHATKAIAKKLGISLRTAESYRAELMQALDIHDIAGLTRYAIRMGLITPDA
jgi:DNA-binding NarL/FixJ family response regulator